MIWARARNGPACAALVALLAPLAAAAVFERPIALPRSGRTVLTLDRDVYDRARADLGDLRVVDGSDHEVPYLLDRASPGAPSDIRRPTVRGRSFVRGTSTTLVLDFGGAVLKRDLFLALSGDRFQRRVSVEGMRVHDREWRPLTEAAYVFASEGGRFETVPLPENNDRHLRVTVFNEAGDANPIDVLDAWIIPRQQRRRPEISMTVVPNLTEDAAPHQTIATVDLGARHQPFLAFEIDAADPAFFCTVTVEAQRDDDSPGWEPLGQGAIYRVADGDGGVAEWLRLDAPGRARVIRLRVMNGSEAPLHIRGVSARIPSERLVFDAAAGGSYRLRYGLPSLSGPTYGLARRFGDADVYAGPANDGRLLDTSPREAAAPPPIREQSRHLLWAAAALVLVTFVALTWRRMRTAA